MIKSAPVVSIGHVADKNQIRFADRDEAGTAWLMLASMSIPAALHAGADGWYPNAPSSAFGNPCKVQLDYSLIPDLKLTRTPTGWRIESMAMQCECHADPEKVWSVVFDIIREYRDRVESECWEVA